MSILDPIRQKLITDGVGADGATGANWPVYIGYAPDTQNQIIQINPTPGLSPVQEEQEGETIRHGFQARVRGGVKDFDVVETKAWAVFNALNDADLSASSIRLIQAVTSPGYFLDEKNRTNFTIDFVVKRDTP